MIKIRHIAVIFLPLILSACVTAEQRADLYNQQQPASEPIKQTVLAHIRQSLFDPYSIRDASISSVVKLGDTGLSAVCVRLNARNRMGGYVGLTATSYRLRGGSVVGALEDAPGCNDVRLMYEPFPEADNL